LKLYEEKLAIALAKQQAEKERKEQQRMYSLYAIAASFAAIVSVAGILLLFSIQNILKRNIDKE
jgi:small neutral amino acid transporter SnatA (MarC family)